MPRKDATRPTAAGLKVRAMTQELKEAAQATESADPLAKFLVMSMDVKGEHDGNIRTRIYLLNPGQLFPGFGGSRSGLLVGKTASLIMRQTAAWGCRDTEYDIADPKAWGFINRIAAEAMKQGTFHIIGAPQEL